MSDVKLVNIGFGNIVMANRIVAIVSPDSSPIKRFIQESRDSKQVIDSTCGRRTRAVIFTDSGYIVLSAIQPETIANRISGKITGEYLPDTDSAEKEQKI